jgi:UDP-GlcNAc:undecaprenyl-phosphate GlcNAc-1-phosphate transferase
MRIAAVAFLLSLAAGATLTPLARRLAHRVGAIDHALSSRKVHRRPIPRLGGLAIVGAFYAPFVALLFVDSGMGHLLYAHPRPALGLFLGGLAIAAVGVYDDLKGAGAKSKFAVQFAAAGLVYALGYRVDALANPFGDPIVLGGLGLPFTLVWIVGVINALNLVDGLDGLAAGVAFVAVLTTFVAALVHGAPFMALTAAALGGAVLGFLRYNFNPASIFMGDTGSMFLGFVLAVSAIKSNLRSATVVAVAVPIVALGVPIADTLLALARRAIRGVPLFQADREHIHHRLLARGLTHRQAVLALYGASLVLGAVALVVCAAPKLVAAGVLCALAIVVGLALWGLGCFRLDLAPEALERRRRNLELRRRMKRVVLRLRRAAHVGEVWEAVKEAASVFDARCVALRVHREHARGRERHLRAGFDEAGHAVFVTRHSLLVERPDGGSLELGWTDGRSSLDRDTETALEGLCRHVHQALTRVQDEDLPRPIAIEAAARESEFGDLGVG